MELAARRAIEGVVGRMSGWQDWAPVYAANGSMTFGSVTTSYARYMRIGSTVWFAINAVGTVGGTPSTGLSFSLPVNAKDGNGYVQGFAHAKDAGTFSEGNYAVYSDVVYVFKAAYANWGGGANSGFMLSGFYEVA